MRLTGICGSLQASSSNLTLLRLAAELVPSTADFEIYDGIRDLPLFDPDIENAGQTPEPVARWRAALRASDALLIAAPEYGHSLPGSLKNAIDWVIGSGELDQKVAAITASTNHAARGQQGLDALVRTCRAVNITVVGGKPIVRGDGERAAVTELLAQIVEAVQLNPPA